MSKNEKPKKVLKKTLVDEILEHNALIHRKNNAKSVMIKFSHFFQKNLVVTKISISINEKVANYSISLYLLLFTE